MLSCFSCVQLFVTLSTVACQAPLSMGFSRQEYWSGLPFPPSGDLPDSGIEPATLKSPTLAGGFFTTSVNCCLIIILKKRLFFISFLAIISFYICVIIILIESIKESGLPWWLSGKESTCNVGDPRAVGLIPGSGRSPGVRSGNPLQ